jgi:hypothetical protein
MSKTLEDVLLSPREVGMSVMCLTLVLTSHDDKRPSRSEAMATGVLHATQGVFSLVFLVIREEEGLEFVGEAPLTLA